jgi:hypothetical protein
MSGSRRIQRSIRVTVAVLLVLLAACGVGAALFSAAWVAASAVAASVAGLVSTRIMYAEVVQTRRTHAHERALQARSFGQAIAFTQQEHVAFTQLMTSRLAEKDRTIRELDGTVRLAEARVDEAELHVQREARRAAEAQARLSELLDEVLAHRSAAEAAAESAGEPTESPDLPTIVDLLAWEDRMNESILEELRGDLGKEA